MNTEHEASRTLVKSPPELWAECSDATSLSRHLDQFGEIRITRLEPETAVAWEGEEVSGTVRLEPSGWGTRVIMTARHETIQVSAPAVQEERAPSNGSPGPEERAPEERAPEYEPPVRAEQARESVPPAQKAPGDDPPVQKALGNEPRVQEVLGKEPPVHEAPGDEPAAWEEPPPQEPEPHPQPNPLPPAAQARPQKLGLFARLRRLFGRKAPPSEREVQSEPAPPAEPVEPVGASQPSVPRALPDPPDPPDPVELPKAAEPLDPAAPLDPPEPLQTPDPPHPVEPPKAAERLETPEPPEPMVEAPPTTEAVLTAALDSLGQAHHRPFSRG